MQFNVIPRTIIIDIPWDIPWIDIVGILWIDIVDIPWTDIVDIPWIDIVDIAYVREV